MSWRESSSPPLALDLVTRRVTRVAGAGDGEVDGAGDVATEELGGELSGELEGCGSSLTGEGDSDDSPDPSPKSEDSTLISGEGRRRCLFLLVRFDDAAGEGSGDVSGVSARTSKLGVGEVPEDPEDDG